MNEDIEFFVVVLGAGIGGFALGWVLIDLLTAILRRR